MSGLQQRLELSRVAALNEEGVGIVSLGQEDAASSDTLRAKTMGQLLCGLLAAVVGIDIEGEIDGAWPVAQLSKLIRVEMGAQRTGDVVKTRLPQHRIVEQSLDQNHLGALPYLLPGIQATLGAGQKAMGKGGADAAAVEVDDVFALAQREDDALIESIGALRVEQAELAAEDRRNNLVP